MIVVIVRTLNEERNIEAFCRGYSWADFILVADAGSEDKTVELAQKFPNVHVREFTEKVKSGEIEYSHEPKHINFLIDWAKSYYPDWIIYDDCDCHPNNMLQMGASSLFSNLSSNGAAMVYVYRLYVYQKDRYFPTMNLPGQSFWAWCPNRVDIRANEDGDPREQNLVIPWPHSKSWFLEKPFVLLHHFAQDDEHIEKKMRWYTAKGQPQLHPLKGCGKLEDLPNYALEA